MLQCLGNLNVRCFVYCLLSSIKEEHRVCFGLDLFALSIPCYVVRDISSSTSAGAVHTRAALRAFPLGGSAKLNKQPNFILISISVCFPEEGMTQQNGTHTFVYVHTHTHTQRVLPPL